MPDFTAEQDDVTYDFGVLLPGVGVFGGVRRFIEIGNELVRRGHRYTIYHPEGTPPGWLPFLGETRSLNTVRDSNHQVLICNNPPLVDDFAAAKADVKFFYFALEKIENERAIATSKQWRILSNSKGMHERLLKRYKVTSDRVVGGINLDNFSPGPNPLNSDEYRVLAFGRVSRKPKGTPIVIRSAEALARHAGQGRKVKLVLFDHVGPGNEKPPTIKCSIPNEMHLNLSQEELVELYRSCDVFISAERRAGWANTVVEAMACGLPVVCTRSGTRDIAIHQETAFVSRFRHHWFLKRGLTEMYDNPKHAAALAKRANQRIHNFSWPEVTTQLLNVVKRHTR